MSLGPYPRLAWSRSRDRTLAACARRYYWDTYGAWGGWREDAPEESRRAYRLKKLRKLDLEVGAAIHRRAHELTEMARGGREPPSVAALRRKTREELARIYRRSAEEFRENPRENPMLRDHYYGEEPPESAVERVREKLAECLPHLRDLDLWEKIRGWRYRVAYADDPAEVADPAVEVDGTGVYASPDLVLWDPEEEAYTVVDWKTGEPRFEDERQLAVHGLFIRQNFEEPECRGRIVYLLDGSSLRVELTPEEIDEARDRVAERIQRMRSLAEDPEVNRPKGREAFPLASDRWECRHCNYFELCEEELRAEGGIPWE